MNSMRIQTEEELAVLMIALPLVIADFISHIAER